MLSNTAIPYYYGMFREKVLRGEILVNQEVSDEMNRIDALIESPDYYYDDEAIDGYCRFCENELTLANGDPLILTEIFKLWAESALAWYHYVEERVFNLETKEYETVLVKQRLVDTQYIIVGRGGAKSMYSGTIQAYELVMNPETTKQVVVAPTKTQANEIMDPIATGITRARGPLFQFLTHGEIKSNTLSKKRLATTKKGIQNFVTNSLIEVRPMRIDKLQGLGSRVNSVDEWLSGRIRENPIQALRQGAAKTKNPLTIATSSEGTVRDGIGDDIKMSLLRILRGEVYAPNISIWYHKLDDISEISDPRTWIKANPNLGVTVSYSTYQKELSDCERDPSLRNDTLAKRFGIPVEGHTYYFTYQETIPHAVQNFDGMTCVMGADLSQGDNFCAFATEKPT